MKPAHQELVEQLKRAVANKYTHVRAQGDYFVIGYEDAPLTHCRTACCIAGDKLLRDMLAECGMEKTMAMVEWYDSDFNADMIDPAWGERMSDIWEYAATAYELDPIMAILVMDSRTNYRLHEFVIEALDAGFCFPEGSEFSLTGLILMEGNYLKFRKVTIDGIVYDDVEDLIRFLQTRLIPAKD